MIGAGLLGVKHDIPRITSVNRFRIQFRAMFGLCLSYLLAYLLLCCVAISESTNSYRLPTIAQFQQMKKKMLLYATYSTHAPIQVLLSRDPRSSCVCRRKEMATVESKENRRDRPGWWSFHHVVNTPKLFPAHRIMDSFLYHRSTIVDIRYIQRPCIVPRNAEKEHVIIVLPWQHRA